MKQYGFFFDQSRCIGCQSCVIACKQWHNIEPGVVKWMRVFQWEEGNFPDIKLHILAISCYHCQKPICIKACPNQAIYKEERYGAVLVDTDKCRGARKCFLACPYGAPQFKSDASGEKMSKCTMCIDRLNQGEKPICVLSCSMRALEFGPLEQLEERYGHLKKLTDMPKENISQPAVVFKPAQSKVQVVPYNHTRALELWKRRIPYEGTPLPDVFADTRDITHAPENIKGRNRLSLKAKTVEERMYYTVDDE